MISHFFTRPFLLFQFTRGTKQAALCLHENLPAGSQEGSAAS